MMSLIEMIVCSIVDSHDSAGNMSDIVLFESSCPFYFLFGACIGFQHFLAFQVHSANGGVFSFLEIGVFLCTE